MLSIAGEMAKLNNFFEGTYWYTEGDLCYFFLEFLKFLGRRRALQLIIIIQYQARVSGTKSCDMTMTWATPGCHVSMLNVRYKPKFDINGLCVFVVNTLLHKLLLNPYLSSYNSVLQINMSLVQSIMLNFTLA